MIFRLSQKLATKLHESDLPSLPLDENPYADWSAHLFTADRTQYIIVANTRSFYSVVMCGKGITDYSQFISRALDNLREFMEADGLAFVYQRLIAPTSASVQFAKALDRTVTGSMNELVKFAKFYLEGGELSPFDIGFKLNDILLSAMAFPTTPASRKELSMTPLRRRMMQDLRLRNLAENTQEAYLRSVAKLAQHFHKSPDLLSTEEVRSYLIYLLEEKHVSPQSYIQVLAALRFLFNVTLGRKEVLEGLPRPKSVKRLPVVLSTE